MLILLVEHGKIERLKNLTENNTSLIPVGRFVEIGGERVPIYIRDMNSTAVEFLKQQIFEKYKAD